MATRPASLYWLRDQWRNQPRMWEDQKVVVHGDATPDNFMFGDHLARFMAFDLERTKHADRVFDTGRIAGELKHFFLRATGNPNAAECFIGHFLWEYACHFSEPRERLSVDNWTNAVLHGYYAAAHCTQQLGRARTPASADR